MTGGMDLSAVAASPSIAKAAEAYKRAVATAATVTAYTVLARSMARELVPYELCAAAHWGMSVVRNRLRPVPKPRRTKTIYIGRYNEGSPGAENRFFLGARAYLATRIDPAAVSRLCLGSSGAQRVLAMVPGDSMKDVFEGVEFTWTMNSHGPANRPSRGPTNRPSRRGNSDGSGDDDVGAVAGDGPVVVSSNSLALSFDADQMEVALDKYIPFIMKVMEGAHRRETSLKIFNNNRGPGPSWAGMSHHHPATFDTVAMEPALKQSIVADLDRFMGRREYYQRIGKAWKRGYLLYGPPGTGKSSLVAAMANHLRFDLYDLDLSSVYSNANLQNLLTAMPNRALLLVEDIDCCFRTMSREGTKQLQHKKKGRAKNRDEDEEEDSFSDFSDDHKYYMKPPPPIQPKGITLSGLLNFIDGLWSTSGEQRVIVFTTNYKERLDPALLRPGRMDMHIHMGYCGWEAFKTLAHNYFLVDDHALFPEIQELLSAVEATPAEVSEMLLRSEDADVALQGFVEFLEEKKKNKGEEATNGSGTDAASPSRTS